MTDPATIALLAYNLALAAVCLLIEIVDEWAAYRQARADAERVVLSMLQLHTAGMRMPLRWGRR